jgi:hypothetical protein
VSGRELAGFFDLVERVGCVRLPAATIAGSTSVAAIVALRAEHVLEDAGPAEALPCPHRTDCAREVRDTWEDGPRVRDVKRRYLTVCGQAPAACEATWLAEDELRTMVVRLGHLVRVATRSFAVERGKSELPHSWGAPTEPRAIGTQERALLDGASRDVFLALRPQIEVSASWLAMRERGARAAVLLVPTMRRIASELAMQHGPMDKVEIVALEDALLVKDGRITVSPRGAALRLVKPAAAGNDTSGKKRPLPTKPRTKPRTKPGKSPRPR